MAWSPINVDGQPDTPANEELVTLMQRLSTRFDGVTPIEEIVWREGLRYEELIKLVENFKYVEMPQGYQELLNQLVAELQDTVQNLHTNQHNSRLCIT